MILDSSAVVAVFLREPEWEGFVDKLGATQVVGIGSPTLAETGLVLAARLRRDPTATLLRFVDEFGVSIVPFGDHHWRVAVEAYTRYGKGRSPAGLNFGDCMSYATARLAGRPLLCAGRDFAKTDLPLA